MKQAEQKRHIVDYDIHGLVGVRLVNPTERDANAVRKQLGPLQKPLRREPDITLEFMKDLPLPDLRYLGLKKVGYNNRNFFILRSSKKDARVAVSFDEIGRGMTWLCQSGLKSVPLLLAVVNLIMLKKGAIALHASAFNFQKTGIVVTGWAKGGKTEALLSFAKHGAEYVGDEWIYLSEDGLSMYGVPENIRLWDWHLENMPHLRSRIDFEKKMLFFIIHRLAGVERLFSRLGLASLFPVKMLREALPALQRQLNVQLPPGTIFKKIAREFAASPDKIFLLLSHESSSYTVTPIGSDEIAGRMAASLQFELMPFMEAYLAFKFAFPERTSDLVEELIHLQKAVLGRALSGKEAYVVRHPYPLSFELLYEAMLPYCAPAENGGWSTTTGVKEQIIAHSK